MAAIRTRDAQPEVLDLRAALQDDRPPDARFFAVVSSGSAATTWLARALNSHPDIFCVHGFNIALRNVSEPSVRVRGTDYAGIIQRLGLHYPIVGDVHGFRPRDVPLLAEALGPNFAAAILVREPIARLKSFLARTTTRRDLDHVDRITARIGIAVPGSDEDTRFFLHSADKLNLILRERPHGPVYRMEDVTTRPEVFAELVRHLSSGLLEPDPEWVERTVDLPAIRLARLEKHELTPREQELVALVVQPAAWEAYEALGYERPSFVPGGGGAAPDGAPAW